VTGVGGRLLRQLNAEARRMGDGGLFLTRARWIAVFPGVALSLTAVGVALLAQGTVGRIRGDE
jgi:hypothetical protein